MNKLLFDLALLDVTNISRRDIFISLFVSMFACRSESYPVQALKIIKTQQLLGFWTNFARKQKEHREQQKQQEENKKKPSKTDAGLEDHNIIAATSQSMKVANIPQIQNQLLIAVKAKIKVKT